jgi:hypothetical protein
VQIFNVPPCLVDENKGVIVGGRGGGGDHVNNGGKGVVGT